MKKLYFLFAILLFGFLGNAQHAYISYPTPICPSYPGVINVSLTGDGNYLGGTFSYSQPGIVIDFVTGAINPAASVSGSYVITYSVPASPPDNIEISCSTVVVIVAQEIPIFNPVPTVCSGSNPPVLPNVSINGISGFWTPSTVDNHNTATYTFIPDGSECAEPTTMTIEVFSPYVPVISTESGLNTVYVDENNQVVAPLELISGQPGGYSFQWAEGNSFITGATNTNYLVDTASPNGDVRFYRVMVTNDETGCDTFSSIFPVLQSNGVPPPQAPRYQNLAPGSTLADVVVSGSGIRWYDSASDKTVNTVELPLTTILTDNTTYYASQTINSNESEERQPVTVNLTLGVGESDLFTVSYSPNPVKAILNIKSVNIIDSVSIINMLGQVLKTNQYHQAEIAEDMDGLNAGTYFVKVTSGERSKVFKVVKE